METSSIFQTQPSKFFSDNGEQKKFQIAAWWQRFLTLLIDLTSIYFASILIAIILMFAGLEGLLGLASGYLYGWLIYFAYYFGQETIWGVTIGKRIMKTRILHKDGRQADLGEVVIRTICRFIPFEALSFLGQSGRPIGWHDKLANTIVVTEVR